MLKPIFKKIICFIVIILNSQLLVSCANLKGDQGEDAAKLRLRASRGGLGREIDFVDLIISKIDNQEVDATFPFADAITGGIKIKPDKHVLSANFVRTQSLYVGREFSFEISDLEPRHHYRFGFAPVHVGVGLFQSISQGSCNIWLEDNTYSDENPIVVQRWIYVAGSDGLLSIQK